MNVIAITAYNKPDLLYLYLEQIYKSDLSNFVIRIHTEEGYDKEEDSVISFFQNTYPTIDIKLIVKQKTNCPIVGFHNILSLYTMSLQEADDYIIVGEEDMLPTDDYIRFNKEVYNKYLSKYDRIFCAGHKRRPEIESPGDPNILIGDYQLTSPSCITTKIVKTYIKPILNNPKFFENPVEFYKNNFWMSRIKPTEHTHHDGALERIMDIYKLFVIKPDQSRSMHVGLSGIFCKGTPPTGSLEERIRQWRILLSEGGNSIRKLSTMPKDITVIPFESTNWDNLELDLYRDKAKASSWHYDLSNNFQRYIDENI